MITRSLPLRLGALVALLVLGGGCDEGVPGTPGTDQAFTLWGYLDPTADQQAIRVVPIVDQIDAEDAEAIDAIVTVTDLASGEVIPFRDSLVTFESGSRGHVFLADWTPSFGRTYRLEARRSDGGVATVDVETPPLVDAEVGMAVSTLADVIYPFSFGGAPNVFGAQIDLLVTGLPSAPMDTSRVSVPFPAARGAGDEVEVAFVSTIRRYLLEQNLGGGRLRLIRAELVAFVANEEWDVPTGRFDDEDEIVEPGTISNVSGGFGFVGGGYFTRTSWTPSVTTQIRAGFASSEDGAARLRINEINAEAGWVELYNPLDEVVSIGGYSLADAPTQGNTTTLPGDAAIPARGFYVVDVTFPIGVPSALYFLNGAGSEVLLRNVEAVPTGLTYGSYPDGRTLIVRLGDDAQDLMGGSLIATRGGPNQPDFQPVLLNEVFTAGDGWAEVYRVPDSGVFLVSVRVITTDREVFRRPELDIPAPGGLAVADEGEGEGLVLEQQSGEVFVLVGYSEFGKLSAPIRYRVVDARSYGLQDPTRSEGRLPDGGGWRSGLTPTRGTSNSVSRPF